MSSDAPSPASSAEDIAAFVTELAAECSPLALDARRGGPPLEVLEQMAAAGRIDAQLRETGQYLRFLPAAPGERTRIEIHDHEGKLVKSLSTAEAIELAAGKTLD